MRDKPALPFADYFEMLRGLTGMKPAAADAAGASMAALDPNEIDKKIAELETVLLWVRAQQGALELSIKTLEFQRNMLRELGAGPSPELAKTASENIAKLAQQFNPATWAWNNLQSVMTKPEATPTSSSTSKSASKSASKRTMKPSSKSASKPTSKRSVKK